MGAQAKAMVQKAKALQMATRASPHTNTQWLSWLNDNAPGFAHLVKTATAQRRHLGKRLEPLADDMPAVRRLQPERKGLLHERLVDKLVSTGPGFCYF